MAYISKGLTLAYNPVDGAATGALENYFDEIGASDKKVFPNLQEIGEISFAGAGGAYDQIEVTTLADNKHKYVDGLIADSDSASNEISFKFLYEPKLFSALKSTMELEESDTYTKSNQWMIEIPEGGKFTFSGDISSLAMDTISTNSALTFALVIAVREIDMSLT